MKKIYWTFQVLLVVAFGTNIYTGEFQLANVTILCMILMEMLMKGERKA